MFQRRLPAKESIRTAVPVTSQTAARRKRIIAMRLAYPPSACPPPGRPGILDRRPTTPAPRREDRDGGAPLPKHPAGGEHRRVPPPAAPPGIQVRVLRRQGAPVAAAVVPPRGPGAEA